jgi:polyisoprenoid-binding protein YceI
MMKNKFTLILLLTLLQLCANAQQRYTLDIKKSKILWKMESMGKHNGYLYLNSGSLNYSTASLPTTGIFTMNMKSIRSTDHTVQSANDRVDGLLQNIEFFNVAHYPTSTIKVKQINKTTNATLFKVLGDLTIKGITNPIEFVASIKKNGETIYITSNMKIDRIKWNINHKPKPTSMFGSLKDKIMADDIQISLDLVLTK